MPKLVVQEGYRKVSEFPIPEGDCTIGRSPDNALSLTRPGVSRHHVKLSRCQAVVTAEDLGSRNGTFLNSRPIGEPTALKHMDVIQLGDAMLLYHETDEGEDVTVVGEGDAAVAPTFDLHYLRGVVHAVKSNISQVLRGKDDVILRVLIALLSDGHVLIEDVPGVWKTMLAQSLAKSIRADFKRIQFTPDLLPTDVTGVNVFDESSRTFSFLPGPVFANVILADEINRGTPRVQSALLECMAESIVTVDGQAHVLPKPFFVMATQNPVDFRGTYPLPEAQLDRFLMRLRIGYPAGEVERDILDSQAVSHPINAISYVVSASDILQCQALVRRVIVSEPVRDYIVSLAEATRRHPAFSYGCSTRASLALMHASQSFAATQGRDFVMPRDVRDLVHVVWGHRLPLTLQARAEWEEPEQVLQTILDDHPVSNWEQTTDE